MSVCLAPRRSQERESVSVRWVSRRIRMERIARDRQVGFGFARTGKARYSPAFRRSLLQSLSPVAGTRIVP